jgi:hypothetical protein
LLKKVFGSFCDSGGRDWRPGLGLAGKTADRNLSFLVERARLKKFRELGSPGMYYGRRGKSYGKSSEFKL